VLPFLRFFLFGVPLTPIEAAAMSAELLTYGLVSGLIYSMFQNKGFGAVYDSLITAMLAGRIVWGLASALLFFLFGGEFAFGIFFSSAFVTALPGIILQLAIIPAIVSAAQVFRGSRNL
jgi:hypothetical protein